MRIGVLTAGGDCPGLNAAIRGVVARVVAAGEEVVGIQKGWRGLMEGLARPLGRDQVRGILYEGGTILGTSRMDPYVHGDGYASVRATVEAEGIDLLVVIGGDGSLRTAARLEKEGLPVVGIPKTIDNDIPGTEVTFGFHTAVQVVTDAIDRLTTTAESHNRVMVVEVMGRTAGWIAACAGLAGGAEAILVPEVDYDLDDLADRLRARHSSGHDYSIVVVAEGTPDPQGEEETSGVDAYGFARLGGVGNVIAHELERRTGYECRVTTLGYLQRGGTPTAYDRILATRLGIAAGELALEGRTGVMVAVRGDRIEPVPLDVVSAPPRALDLERYQEAAWFFA
ncbi:MAG TPA: ATP-dependent 6-phosphofructokinase [Acidimicrobiia bacterium]|jgi:6-phosphofructokinase 1|nr:ATP-dependent 6-phosphofructokinase [Acidimicrobiia bacterium]